MKYPIYCMRDVHVGFLSPMVDQNDASAMRNFKHALMRSDSVMNTHQKDFSLYRIGEFDTDSGELVSCIPDLVIDGMSV